MNAPIGADDLAPLAIITREEAQDLYQALLRQAMTNHSTIVLIGQFDVELSPGMMSFLVKKLVEHLEDLDQFEAES